ncbi:hypothetical protein [Roseovarius sp.]|uniref:hypothetical protein n=1 Tax=Roseovarius sp. TaxID=1486281 RepID=UPI003562C616
MLRYEMREPLDGQMTFCFLYETQRENVLCGLAKDLDSGAGRVTLFDQKPATHPLALWPR